MRRFEQIETRAALEAEKLRRYAASPGISPALQRHLLMKAYFIERNASKQLRAIGASPSYYREGGV